MPCRLAKVYQCFKWACWIQESSHTGEAGILYSRQGKFE